MENDHYPYISGQNETSDHCFAQIIGVNPFTQIKSNSKKHSFTLMFNAYIAYIVAIILTRLCMNYTFYVAKMDALQVALHS